MPFNFVSSSPADIDYAYMICTGNMQNVPFSCPNLMDQSSKKKNFSSILNFLAKHHQFPQILTYKTLKNLT